mgnify:CR=1 FL=1
MAKLPYSWNKVSPGDIVSFVYENKDGRKLRRTILVLDPKLLNRAKNPSSKYLVQCSITWRYRKYSHWRRV